jgi:hypothetical protein
LAVVERDNRILLDRLGKAMETKNIDNNLEPVKFTSIGEENRKKALRKVTADNLRLLNRIQNVEPVYRAVEWERDAEQRDKYLATMTEFPDQFVPKYSPSRQYQRAQDRAAVALTPVSPRQQAMARHVLVQGGLNTITPPFESNTPVITSMTPLFASNTPVIASMTPPFVSNTPVIASSGSPYIAPPPGDPLRNGLQRPYSLQNLNY